MFYHFYPKIVVRSWLTELQLGYSVSSGVRQTYGMMGFCFKVVSASHDANQIIASVQTFISDIPNLISAMSEDEFADNVAALTHNLLDPFSSLSESANNNWSQIDERRLEFGERFEKALLLQDTTLISNKQIIIDFSSALFCGDQRKLLVVQATPHLQAETVHNQEGLNFTSVSDYQQIHSMCGYAGI